MLKSQESVVFLISVETEGWYLSPCLFSCKIIYCYAESVQKFHFFNLIKEFCLKCKLTLVSQLLNIFIELTVQLLHVFTRQYVNLFDHWIIFSIIIYQLKTNNKRQKIIDIIQTVQVLLTKRYNKRINFKMFLVINRLW